MRQALYPDPQGNYYCYVFDEEVKLSTNIDIEKILLDARTNNELEYEDEASIFMTGEELIKYRK